MERSMNGRAPPLDSREMRAFSSYMRWLSTGIPDGAKLVGAGTLGIKEPARTADLGHGAQVFPGHARHATARMDSDSARKPGPGISFHRSGVPIATTTAPEWAAC
jgi:hypothetical protein